MAGVLGFKVKSKKMMTLSLSYECKIINHAIAASAAESATTETM